MRCGNNSVCNSALAERVIQFRSAMKLNKCPYCGSSKVTQSPSGEHQLCQGCQRILVMPRAKSSRKGAGDGKSAEPAGEPVAVENRV